MPGLDQLCLGETRLLLIELPFTDFSDAHVYSIKMLIKQGYTVVLAHADRYPEENIERLLPLGAKIQLNASSISGFMAKKHLFRWIEKGYVVALGSDIHMADKKAYSSFIKARKKLGNSFDEIMIRTNDILFK